MRSNNTFYTLLKEDMKKRAWLFVLFIIIFAVRIPLFLMSQMHETSYLVSEGGIYNHAEQVRQWFESIMGLQNFQVVCLVIFCAVLSGITSFTMLHSKEQTDFYNSLPIRRETWFGVSCVSSALQFMIPYITGYLLLFLCGLAKGVVSEKVKEQAALVILFTCLFYLLIYSVTALAVILTGKMIMAILAAFTFLFFGSFLGALYQYIMMLGFETYSMKMVNGNTTFLEILFENGWVSPILSYLKIASRMGDGMYQNDIVKSILLLVFATALIQTLAFVVYKIRPSESAGRSIAFPVLEPVIKVVLSVSGSLFLAITLTIQKYNGKISAVWMFFVGILSVFIFCGAIEFAFSTDLKMILQKKKTIFFSIGCVLAVMICVYYDIPGYNTYIPEKEKIESMSIDYQELNQFLLQEKTDSKSQYINKLKEYRVHDFEPIYEIAQIGISNVKKEKDPDQQIPVTIVYYLKDGRAVYRSYFASKKQVFDCTKEIFEDKQYKEKRMDFGEVIEDKVLNISLTDLKGNHTTLNLTDLEKEELMNVYKKEVLEQPLDIFKEQYPIGEMFLSYESDGVEIQKNVFYYIYENYSETLALLKKFGYTIPVSISVEEIKDISFIDEYENEIHVTKPERMEKVLEHISYTSNRFLDERKEDVQTVILTFKNGKIDIYYLQR